MTSTSNQRSALTLPTAAQLHANEARWGDLLRLAWWTCKAMLAGWFGKIAIALMYLIAWAYLALFLTSDARSLGIAVAMAAPLALAAVAVLIAVIAVLIWATYLARSNCGVYLSRRDDAAIVLILRRRGRTIEPSNHVARNVGKKQAAQFRKDLGEPLFQWLNTNRVRLQAQVTSRKVLKIYLSEWGQFGLKHVKCGRLVYAPTGWTRR